MMSSSKFFICFLFSGILVITLGLGFGSVAANSYHMRLIFPIAVICYAAVMKFLYGYWKNKNDTSDLFFMTVAWPVIFISQFINTKLFDSLGRLIWNILSFLPGQIEQAGNRFYQWQNKTSERYYAHCYGREVELILDKKQKKEVEKGYWCDKNRNDPFGYFYGSLPKYEKLTADNNYQPTRKYFITSADAYLYILDQQANKRVAADPQPVQHKDEFIEEAEKEVEEMLRRS